jgi:hypothetical protein
MLCVIVFMLPAAVDLMAPVDAGSMASGLAVDTATIAADPAVRAWAQRLLDNLAARASGSS